MRILAIDPGTFESGYVMFDGASVIKADILKNDEMLLAMTDILKYFQARRVAIEMIASYGMPVGAETFETCVWVGRFMQRAIDHVPQDDVKRIYRKAVKVYLCGTTKAKDGNIRQALLDKLGPVGTKKAPGPLYGVKSHCWAALAVAVTALGI